MYTRFSGENGQSPARWLRTLKYELPSTFTAGQLLECVDGLLDGKAARWADKWPDVKHILSDEYLKHATHHDVVTFKALLLSRFTPADEGLEDVVCPGETLHQNIMESLEDYYRRAEDLLHTLGGKDSVNSVNLSDCERDKLRRVIGYFVNGLHHSCLKSDMALQGESLLQTYRITRGYERLMLEWGEHEFLKIKNKNDPWESERAQVA